MDEILIGVIYDTQVGNMTDIMVADINDILIGDVYNCFLITHSLYCAVAIIVCNIYFSYLSIILLNFSVLFCNCV